jgi:hypothetical protein
VTCSNASGPRQTGDNTRDRQNPPATALGHIAIRRRRSVLFARADQLFRDLMAARLDNSVEAEMRRLARVVGTRPPVGVNEGFSTCNGLEKYAVSIHSSE